MKLIWPATLRARLVGLVLICTLPPMTLVIYTAIERYHSSKNYAYQIGKLVTEDIISRYENLASRSRGLLSAMELLSAISAPPAACSAALTEVRDRMPLYDNFSVISVNGDIHCGTGTSQGTANVADRAWFRQMLAAPGFINGVISRTLVTHKMVILFAVPHYDDNGKLDTIITATVSTAILQPPESESSLRNNVEITVLVSDGTVVLHNPDKANYLGSNQSHSTLFRAASNPGNTPNQVLPGIDGRVRLYTLRHFTTDVPGQIIYVTGGIDRALVERVAFLPLLRDLIIIAAIAVFIVLCAWWFATAFVTRRVQPLLQTLQRIGAGELRARTGLAESGGEMGEIARGVDVMAENLEARVTAQHAAERAHESSEERYRELVEQSSDSIIVRRVTGELTFVNAALCKMLGYSRDELLRMRITDLVDESNLRGHRLMIGGSLRFESWMRHKDGHRVPVEVITMRLKNGDVQSIQRDISERLKTHRTLEASERHYRELVEQAMLGILVRRPTGEIVFANPAICDMSGYSRHELLRMHITTLVDRSDAAAFQRVQKIGIGDYLNFQSRMRHKSGRVVHVEVSAHRFSNQHIQLMINNVSARVVAEQQFAEERNFVFNAIDILPGVFYVFNSEGRFLRWNRQMEKITGYSQEEMGQIKSSDIVPPEQRIRFLKTVEKILSGTGIEGDAELYCRDGRRIPYYYVARSFEWQGQACVVGMGVDITDRKEAEQRVQIYLEELQQLSARLLAAQEEERRRLARELHDEMGQALTAALLSLRDLAGQVGPGAFAEQLQQISNIITQLTQQMRTLSLNLRPSVLDDLGLAAAVRWYIRERVESVGLQVVLEMDKSLPRLNVLMETTCFRVLQGALTNVLRHAHARQVHVVLQAVNSELVLTVHDDGQGFDVNAARREALGGKSFGLLGMEERVRLAGGKFAITSSKERGTQVRVVLPLV